MHPTLSEMRKELGLRHTPFLVAFEEYCFTMGSNVRALEWSHKFRGGSFEGSRFLHTAKDGSFQTVQQPIDRLLRQVLPVGDSGAAARTAFDQLCGLAKRCADGAAIGYADRHGPHGRVSELKLYFSTRDVEAILSFAAAAAPEGALPPQGTWRVMTALSMQEDGRLTSRVYYLWRRSDLNDAWRSWADRWCTEAERQLLGAGDSPTVCVSFKAGGRDMLYLATPLGLPDLEAMISKLCGSADEVPSYIARLRWVGFSKWQEGLPSREVNLYFPAATG